ncbi:filamentous hemagglutinin N-terminal domain-containing protein [Candidatus Parabeggiatoa sp. HSG14]|uniref:two-partner secretion domain-containing protein n=1 Tax=Candidatus Parabeggiatoa sp. HSG14 TaxID=3055593 RepID=UPI0025A7B4EC|nr:filamentous hemagglutinin N-terminal domain-containing protein [Thiotrichales bacterium HSG14]
MKSPPLLIIPILIISLSINAEITTDGSLGSRANLPGPDYLIGADLGRQMDGNLFHSFQDFNLQSLESVTFSGPNTVQNILSRVTGGNPSNIDGLIRSTIPNADMYFLNPYGIMFGPNAKLDVQGSFHASTADYLQLGENGRFDARNPSDSLLTIAPITAFGFLTDNPSPIYFQGSQLHLPSEITIVGGNILMEQANLLAGGGGMNGGHIKIASVASQGEVVLLESDLLVSSFDDLGNISLFGRGELEVGDDADILNVDGKQAGLVLIRGKNMLLANRGFIDANTYGGNADETDPGAGKGVNIKLSGQLKLTETSDIVSKALGSWQTAPIMIEVERLELRDGSQISSNVWSSGQGNHLTIKANEILLSGLSDITITSNAGIITRNASGISSISNTSKLDAIESTINIEAKRLIIENQAQINVASIGTSNAGSVNLKVEHLEVIQGGAIISTTIGLGNGGSIYIDADNIILSEVGSINSSGFGPGKGKAGDITIEANNLELFNGGNINISTLGLGKSGAINIKVLDSLHLSGQADESQFFFYDFVNEQIGGLFPVLGVIPEDLIGPSKISAAVINLGPESAGNIDIEAGRLSLQNGVKITGEHRGMGDAGNIGIRVSDIRLNQSTITTETFGGGGGGNITFNVPNLLYLREGDITTSVGTGRGQGGDISIENPTFVAMDKGKIIAQADVGHGGNIRIAAEQFLKSPESLISASSRLGLDGSVHINSPTVDMNAFLVVLPGGFVEAQLRKCTWEEIDNPSTFKVDLSRDRKGLPFGKFLKLK